MTDVKAVRWRRYGKDRLYVKGAAGAELGWVDLLTGKRTVTDPERRQAFDAAVNAWYVETAIAVGAGSPAAPEPTPIVAPTDTAPELTPTTPEPPTSDATTADPEDTVAAAASELPAWHDVATHVPGQAARKQAMRELAAMRERSRLGSVIARTFDMKTDERAWRIGADGEETVGAKLSKLIKDGWHVLHSVPVGSGGTDIDHVVVGWGGVYTLNTKTHPGKRVWVGEHAVKIDGHSEPYLQKSRGEAERAGKLLSLAVGFTVPIQSALVFLTGTRVPNVTIKQMPTDVLIYDRTDIPKVFKRAPRRLDEDQIAAIYEAARRCTTWTGSTRCTCTGSTAGS